VAGQQDHATADLSGSGPTDQIEDVDPLSPDQRVFDAGFRTPLPRSFFARDPRVIAPELLGVVVENEVDGVRVGVRLTEVEAYLGEGEDPASHSHRGPTPRNAVMFGPPGHAYVYFTYGMHWCANVSCRPVGVSGGVLLRAGEVVSGLDSARSRRIAARRDVDLARGPARLASALGLTGADNGRDFCGPDDDHDGDDHGGNDHGGNDHGGVDHGGTGAIAGGGEDRGLRMLAGAPVRPALIRSGPRVGVATGATSPWRFWLADEPTVSVYRPAKPRTPRARPVKP
jgi:DNA-3-methyladenine glycosylase